MDNNLTHAIITITTPYYLDGDQIAWLQGMLEAQKIMMNIKTGRRVPVYRLRYQNLLPECYNS
jgi:hypothetical protein